LDEWGSVPKDPRSTNDNIVIDRGVLLARPCPSERSKGEQSGRELGDHEDEKEVLKAEKRRRKEAVER
jgi:hypothetical protein